MKKIYLTLVVLLATINMFAQGWPANYSGVMLQGFYWDSFSESKWTKLEAQAPELGQYFNLVWIPQSAYCGSKSMGYDDLYWFSNYESSFGSESELRSLIKTFKNNGIGTIADVVINHRKNVSTWFDFPVEIYKGVTYEMKSTDICANDDGGKTKKEADKQGVKLSSNNDTGTDWDGMRDLDHSSQNVQTIVKAYLDMLLNDFGYAGFRYDMVKGYSGKFTGIYNTATKPSYSVGEYWDGDVSKVKNWLESTKVNEEITSAAFDFPIRYVVRDAINGKWSDVKTDGLANDNSYKQYAITFVENHDTEYRSAGEQQDPIRKDTLAANAYILASCGTPCVFYKHWIDCKQDIKAMINARQLAGITNTSNTTFNAYKGEGYNGIMTTGTKTSLLAIVGPNANKFEVSNAYAEILNGYHYRYFMSKKANVAWVNLASGEYEGAQKAKLVAVSNKDNAQLVYTTDGTEPTASSKKAKSGEEIELPIGETTLKVGLLVDGAVSSVITRTYQITKPVEFEPYDITVYANADQVGWNDGFNFWAWCEKPDENLTTTKKWPGDKVTQCKEIEGKKWYYQTYKIKSKDYKVSFVFSTGTGTPQTVDFTDINKDTYLEVLNEKNNEGHYKIKDVTADMPTTGITDAPVIDKATSTNNAWYTLDGMKMNQKPQQTGIYIHQGKKIVIR
jgi:alpha-amylase